MPIFPTPTPWSATTLSTGPLLGGTYVCNIQGLSPSIIYEYRAYSVIDGVPYYGNPLTGCTSAEPTHAPCANTGYATCVTDTSMSITGNSVSDKGGLPIAEYGVLYTQVPSYGNSSCLVYEAYPAKIGKKSCPSNIGTGDTYFTTASCWSICCLSDNTTTYYRAFAKNSTGCGYGTIKTQATCSPPPPPTLQMTLIACTDCLNLYLGGAYCLVCCNGNNYATIIVGSPIQECTIFSCTLYGVPAGSYYVDYSGLGVYCCDGWYQISSNMNWDINASCYGYSSCCTACFDYNANVCGCIYGSA